ncbi:MAG: hypothetical protein VX913_03750 [Planctomycetota bacterium]|nr:hypothetical protein [Planctomycetota bacterium]
MRACSLGLRSSLVLVCMALSVSGVAAQSTTNIPLNCNFNGIVHAGESGVPDSAWGFRSISDRGLDFSAGVPVDPLLAPYAIVNVPSTSDIVHLGNRNTVTGGAFVFDAMPDGDNIGVQPNWLINVDQTTPQTSNLPSPITVQPGFTTTVSVLFQISNGGGSFDVTIGFLSGATTTTNLSGGDWYGGPYAGTGQVDSGAPDNNLSITEGTINVSGHVGEAIAWLSFSNRSNQNAGYAIIAANVNASLSDTTIQIPLNYNYNGIVHTGESGMPDAPTGYRSISDRGLDFTAGVPASPLLAPYFLMPIPGVLDIVHLGNRNTVTTGIWAFQPTANGDNIGIQPNWLTNVNQSTPQTTNLSTPVNIGLSSAASFLYQISDGGGSFDVTFGFQSGNGVTQTLSSGDWYGGAFPGTASIDYGGPDANLGITEGNVDLSAHVGDVLTTITFSNGTNPNAGIAILAANVTGCLTCGTPGGVSNVGGGNGVTLTTTSTGQVGCAAALSVSGATPSAPGLLLVDLALTPLPTSAIFSGCTGTINIQIANPLIQLNTVTDAAGNYTLVYPAANLPPALCGITVYAQYGEYIPGAVPCPIRLSDTLSITFGD